MQPSNTLARPPAVPGPYVAPMRVAITKIMQGLRIIFFPTILILRYFYPHQLIGIFPESFFMNARPEAERRISTFNFPFLFFGLGKSSVNHGFLFLFVMFCLRACCCLLLLCSRVPSPGVLCVHRPLPFLLNSHALLLLHVVDGPNSLLHSLWRTPHPYRPCSIDFSLRGLTGSFCRLPRPISPTN